ncbi:hypothetical protein PI86_13760 [Burkholderia sp. A9]|nr:hypothetical protein PI86_13760 [Burkholderia sp. A9]
MMTSYKFGTRAGPLKILSGRPVPQASKQFMCLTGATNDVAIFREHRIDRYCGSCNCNAAASEYLDQAS